MSGCSRPPGGASLREGSAGISWEDTGLLLDRQWEGEGKARDGHAKERHPLRPMDVEVPAQQEEAGPQTQSDVAKVRIIPRPWEGWN